MMDHTEAIVVLNSHHARIARMIDITVKEVETLRTECRNKQKKIDDDSGAMLAIEKTIKKLGGEVGGRTDGQTD